MAGKKMLISLLLVFGVFASGETYRILGLFAFNGKSHFVMFERLMKALASRGHQVDVASTYPLKKPYPNYTDIIVFEQPNGAWVNNLTFSTLQNDFLVFRIAPMVGHIGNDICKNMKNPDLQAIVKNPPKDPPYDLVILEIFAAHCFVAIGHKFGVPVIGVSSSDLYPWGNRLVANPENLALVPTNLAPQLDLRFFWNRLTNVIDAWIDTAEFDYETTSIQNEYIRKYVGPDVPGVRELEKTIALILVNTHISINGIKPTTPALVEVGGLHIHDDGPDLPQDLQQWLDESKDGVVYFSFGSMVRIETFPRDILLAIYQSLRKIAPVRVLMKIPDPRDLPPGLPDNVLTRPWISQLKVLNHKNVRAFVTHGGLMGTQEAIHYAVPMIGIPLFADQHLNVDFYVEKKIAVKVDYKTLTVEKMDAALNAILYDPTYRETVKELSDRFLDRPLSAVDTAVFWVEYIIRNGGDSLRSPALDLAWWQEALLDVFAVFLSAILVLIYLAYLLIRLLARILRRNRLKANLSKKNR
ncbi:UDP-glucuronosyltransferase 2C1 [Orussus abietinus]|uniref:UDP-glucuronosyltransferase 2C1 n=1 Tax=Orussus abietinus TaxID=222816 RepID=UPI0006266E73|nr:UDP-glucuronosyltransferase 2C1 [Orussus abietinus]